jgi:phosphohistidine swiveling domain-containing protein
MSEPANPVHMTSGPSTRWTTVNFAEAIQGVQKPLGWSIWDLSMETAVRAAFGAIGVLARREVPPPPSPDDRISGIFYGRVAGNVDVFHMLGDRMPGSSGDTLEQKLFGKEPGPDGPTKKPLAATKRYPIVAVQMPRAARAAAKRIRPMRDEYREWWQRTVLDEPPQDLQQAQALYREGAERFMRVGVHHAVATLLGNALLEQLELLATKATGEPAVAMELATGYGSMEETELIEDLWSVGRGRLELNDVVRRHGYHGPDEGDLSNRTWREDRAPLESIVRGYVRSDLENPRDREQRQVQRRLEAEQRVLAGLSARARPGARLTMKLASTYIPLRELGKAAFLHALDAARCGARAGGRMLELDDPEDVFFLTGEEFGRGEFDLSVIAERKERHKRYKTVSLPPEFTGPPEPVAIVQAVPASANGNGHGELRGIGIVGDKVTGRARVIHDPNDADLEPGDILVCVTTDPSWTPLFMLADALVIDTGGAMSHGAIVARELGVTCVINTVTGTRDIPDGATITVDGASGAVTIGA